MPAAQPGHVTLILARVREGQDAAVHELLPLVYDELRALARRQIRHRTGTPTPTLQPTVLVHEAYLRLVGSGPAWESRAHFFAVAAIAMRQVLSNYAREQAAEKRGGGMERVTLVEGREPGAAGVDLDLLALNQALERLQAVDARQARIVTLRYLSGMSEEEVAHVLQISTRTVEREWRVARAWLAATLGG